MRLETRRLADLKPAEYNPRIPLKPGMPEYEMLAASIEQNGYIDPIIINEDGTIISGHQRRTVLMDMGREEAEILIVDIKDKETEIAANIALNKITGEWDTDKLQGLLIRLEDAGIDTRAAGFDDQALGELFAQVEELQEAEEDEFDAKSAMSDADGAGEGSPAPRTKRGDIYALGGHRLMCGDASDFSDIADLMSEKTADLCITDPPYGVNYEEKNSRLGAVGKNNTKRKVEEISGDNFDADVLQEFLFQSFSNIHDVMKPGGAIYVFHADSLGLNFRRAFIDAGFPIREILIWEKSHFVISRQDYHWRHEPILYGWKDGAAHYFIDDRTQDSVLLDDEPDWEDMKKPELVAYIKELYEKLKERSTVQYEKKQLKSDLHPTMKPVPLVGRLMTNSSRKGDIVLDTFGGSGTTLIAAEQLQRRAYLMEVNPRYCDIIVDRWEDFTGRKAVKIEGE